MDLFTAAVSLAPDFPMFQTPTRLAGLGRMFAWLPPYERLIVTGQTSFGSGFSVAFNRLASVWPNKMAATGSV